MLLSQTRHHWLTESKLLLYQELRIYPQYKPLMDAKTKYDSFKQVMRKQLEQTGGRSLQNVHLETLLRIKKLLLQPFEHTGHLIEWIMIFCMLWALHTSHMAADRYEVIINIEWLLEQMQTRADATFNPSSTKTLTHAYFQKCCWINRKR